MTLSENTKSPVLNDIKLLNNTNGLNGVNGLNEIIVPSTE